MQKHAQLLGVSPQEVDLVGRPAMLDMSYSDQYSRISVSEKKDPNIQIGA